MKNIHSENPGTKYPQPPFKKQHQPVPGITKLMDPMPDHGESSYVGHGILNGKPL